MNSLAASLQEPSRHYSVQPRKPYARMVLRQHDVICRDCEDIIPRYVLVHLSTLGIFCLACGTKRHKDHQVSHSWPETVSLAEACHSCASLCTGGQSILKTEVGIVACQHCTTGLAEEVH